MSRTFSMGLFHLLLGADPFLEAPSNSLFCLTGHVVTRMCDSWQKRTKLL